MRQFMIFLRHGACVENAIDPALSTKATNDLSKTRSEIGHFLNQRMKKGYKMLPISLSMSNPTAATAKAFVDDGTMVSIQYPFSERERIDLKHIVPKLLEITEGLRGYNVFIIVGKGVMPAVLAESFSKNHALERIGQYELPSPQPGCGYILECTHGHSNGHVGTVTPKGVRMLKAVT